tara:strand:- start:3925 stop:4362 length:438 start_codon:yes stop_codon:yes gene_type:complete
MKHLLLLILAAAVFASCMPVPNLLSTSSVRAQYIGYPESKLVVEHGVADQTMDDSKSGKICTWNLGTTTSGAAVNYGYGIYGTSSSQSAKKLTAFIDGDGIVTDLQTNGYSLGNEDEIQSAKQTNSYLGTLYGLGIASLLLLLAI